MCVCGDLRLPTFHFFEIGSTFIEEYRCKYCEWILVENRGVAITCFRQITSCDSQYMVDLIATPSPLLNVNLRVTCPMRWCS